MSKFRQTDSQQNAISPFLESPLQVLLTAGLAGEVKIRMPRIPRAATLVVVSSFKPVPYLHVTSYRPISCKVRYVTDDGMRSMR